MSKDLRREVIREARAIMDLADEIAEARWGQNWFRIPGVMEIIVRAIGVAPSMKEWVKDASFDAWYDDQGAA